MAEITEAGRNKMLPLRHGGGGAPSTVQEYFSRVLDYPQMDLQSTFFQMVTLLQHPEKVYKTSYYRKRECRCRPVAHADSILLAETKNQWARDDPAFAVVQVVFLVVASCAYGVAFKMTGVLNYMWLIANVTVVHWLGCGVVVCTACWYA